MSQRNALVVFVTGRAGGVSATFLRRNASAFRLICSKTHNMGVVGVDGNGLNLITTDLDQSTIKWLHTWVSDLLPGE